MGAGGAGAEAGAAHTCSLDPEATIKALLPDGDAEPVAAMEKACAAADGLETCNAAASVAAQAAMAVGACILFIYFVTTFLFHHSVFFFGSVHSLQRRRTANSINFGQSNPAFPHLGVTSTRSVGCARCGWRRRSRR